ncbi:feline leukemia virus subgroup C receptor-related protein 2-like [Hydractinia symbiolongicarpus]|uniref:feline leukemia virus subgroup C receptor-related protein 2-like n=1 Tax=Hydractinia symbiolongicarpus TaxID=13093 RepID=UPI002550A852|nr:feline leukemia virus subgroup C receptor-related protein 2-like [Hydractinia symbiolongicarpus]
MNQNEKILNQLEISSDENEINNGREVTNGVTSCSSSLNNDTARSDFICDADEVNFESCEKQGLNVKNHAEYSLHKSETEKREKKEKEGENFDEIDYPTCSTLNIKEESAQEENIYKIYSYRWLILFIFSMNTMINGVLFTGLSPVTNIASNYYNVSSVIIDWLSNSFMIVYVFVALPAAYLMFIFGLRPLLTAISCMHSLAMLLRYIGHENERFSYILAGQCLGAISFGMLLQIPGQLSSVWFPENERSKATSIGVAMNLFGVGIAFLQTTSFVKNSTDQRIVQSGFEALFVTQLAFSVVIFLLTIVAYKEKPETSPSHIVNVEELQFTASLKHLSKSKDFLFMSQSYAIYYALLVCFTILLNVMVTTYYPEGYERKIGWMGFTGYVVSICSCVLVGLWLDKFHAHQLVAMFLNGLSAVTWLLFVFLLTQTKNFISLFIYFSVVASVAVPNFATGIEQAAEMTYPVPVIISSSVILVLSNLYAFILLLCFGLLAEAGFIQIVCYTMFGFYLVSTLLSCLARTELKRGQAEEEALNNSN